MEQLLQNLTKICPVQRLDRQRENLVFITVDAAHLRQVLLHLRDKEQFTHLVLLTAVDWLEEGIFQLTYLLNSRSVKADIGVRLCISREKAEAESIHDIWPTAATYQRELREMFGINFPGSPRIEEDFVLEGWKEIPPYRRDFDTKKFAEENFNHRPGRETKDPAHHMKEKLYPDEA